VVLPALGEAEVRVEGAVLPGPHLGDEFLARLGDLAVLQLLVHAAALLESAPLQVLLPTGVREPFLQDALARGAVQREQLDAQRVPLAHAVGLAVLEGLHVVAVPAAVGPGAVGGEVGGDEDGLARIRDQPFDLLHIGRKRTRLAGGEVIEDRAQIAGELLAVLDGEDREERTEDRERQPQDLERRLVQAVPPICRPQHVEQHCALLVGSLAISKAEADVRRGGAG